MPRARSDHAAPAHGHATAISAPAPVGPTLATAPSVDPTASDPTALGRSAAVPTSPPTPLQLAPLAIGMMALDGAREFQIRLDPAELGRVDVKLTIAEDGRVSASLVVDRVETLAMLQRDARTLERAFDQAGLNADSGSLSFSLRQDDASRQQAQDQNERPGGRSIGIPVEQDLAADLGLTRAWRGRAGQSGVDILI
jgi:flagellar hook-length control protein FliK